MKKLLAGIALIALIAIPVAKAQSGMDNPRRGDQDLRSSGQSML